MTSEIATEATAKVLEALSQWGEAVESRDPDRVVALYDTHDGVLWGTVSAFRRDTPELIRDYFVHFLANPGIKVRFYHPYVRILADGSVAVNTGYYTFMWRQDDRPTREHARFSFVYRRQGERWLIVDHHSSAVPEGGV